MSDLFADQRPKSVAPAFTFSEDQAEAWDRVASALETAGVDITSGDLMPDGGGNQVLSVIGKAGSGKTMLLAELYKSLEAAGVEVVSGDWEGRRRKEKRTLAILAPTNKAASVLRSRGVPATTIHRILYTPVYDPQYERIAEWLAGQGDLTGLPHCGPVAVHVHRLTHSGLPRRRFYSAHRHRPALRR